MVLCSLVGSDGMCSQSGLQHRLNRVQAMNGELGFMSKYVESKKRLNQDALSLLKPNDRSFLSPDPLQKYPGSQAKPGSSITTILNTNT